MKSSENDPMADFIQTERMPAVQAYRKAKGETFSGLARGAGISTERLAEIEKGSKLKPHEVASIAMALGISETDLVVGHP